MKHIWTAILGGTLAIGALSAQGRGGCGGCGPGGFPAASLTELKGTVAAVQLAPGAGLPSVTVKSGTESKVVYLGSMRYLMMQGFNPKVDEEIVVKAFPSGEAYYAASVTLPAENQSIRLRDADGRPLWGGGRGWMRGAR